MNKDPDGELIYDNQAKMHWHLVHDPETSGSILHELCDVLPDFLLERVAEHRGTEPRTLVRLSMHNDANIRAAVCENPNTPPDVLLYLLNDECADVRYSMAENHNLAPNLLDALCEDDNPYVSSRAQKTVLRLRAKKCVEGQFKYNDNDNYQERYLGRM